MSIPSTPHTTSLKSEFEQLIDTYYEWDDILSQLCSQKNKEDLGGFQNVLTTYEFFIDEDAFSIITRREDEDAFIFYPESAKKVKISKLEAIRLFHFGQDKRMAEEVIREGIALGQDPADRLARKIWEKHMLDTQSMDSNERFWSDPGFAALVHREMTQDAAREYAVEKRGQVEFLGEGLPKEATVLTDFLEKIFEYPKFMIEGLMRNFSVVHLAAQAKAGKTTLVCHLIKCLVDGTPFLGKFPTSIHDGKVGYMNLELPEDQMQEWLDRQEIENTDNLVVWNLRDEPSPFRSKQSRSYLVKQLKANNITTLIIDTWAKIYTDDENSPTKTRQFLKVVDDVATEAGVERVVTLFHAGHNGKKIRGSSSYSDHPDAIWFINRDENDRRTFNAYGRDVFVEEGELLLDKSTGVLTYTGRSKTVVAKSRTMEKMLEIINLNPLINASSLDEQVSGSKTQKVSARRQLVREGLVVTTNGPKNSVLYSSAPKS